MPVSSGAIQSAVRFKVMIVAEALGPAPQHAILKMMNPGVRGDAASALQFQPEMASFPGYFLPQSDQP